jgi:hypothetical protein
MYQAIIGVLGACSIALIYSHLLEIPKWLSEKWSISIKPFNCGLCMSFWFSLAYNLFHFNLDSAVYLSAITPILYTFIQHEILEKW